jgi:hypothetical protein
MQELEHNISPSTHDVHGSSGVYPLCGHCESQNGGTGNMVLDGHFLMHCYSGTLLLTGAFGTGKVTSSSESASPMSMKMESVVPILFHSNGTGP